MTEQCCVGPNARATRAFLSQVLYLRRRRLALSQAAMMARIRHQAGRDAPVFGDELHCHQRSQASPAYANNSDVNTRQRIIVTYTEPLHLSVVAKLHSMYVSSKSRRDCCSSCSLLTADATVDLISSLCKTDNTYLSPNSFARKQTTGVVHSGVGGAHTPRPAQ